MSELRFDSSGSAVIRFFGRPVGVKIHWVKAMIGQNKMVCPDSIGVLKKKMPCALCNVSKTLTVSNHELIVPGQPAKTTDRVVSSVWDVKDNKMHGWMFNQAVMGEVFSKMTQYGFAAGDMVSGKSMDVLVQRVGSRIEVAVMPETAGQERGDEHPYDLNTYLRELARASVWRFNDDPTKVTERYAKTSLSLAAEYSGDREALDRDVGAIARSRTASREAADRYLFRNWSRDDDDEKPKVDPKPAAPPDVPPLGRPRPRIPKSEDPWDHL